MKYFVIGGVYFITICLFYLCNHFAGFFDIDFNAFDVSWYLSIAQNGYIFHENAQSNVAFFPLFPYVWKYLGLSLAGMAFLNLAIYSLTISWLANSLQMSFRLLVFVLCIPLNIFLSVPYTESLFFLFGVMVLVGALQDSNLLVCSGLLLASFTRPVFPALLATFCAVLFIYFFKSDRAKLKSYLLSFCIIVSILFFAFAAVNYIQFYQTNVWFAQSKTYKFWNACLSLPGLPLRTFEQPRTGYWILQFDYLAFLWSLYGVYIVLYMFRKQAVWQKYDYIFAGVSVYMVTIFGLRLFTMGGDLWSLSRYIFVSPAFVFSLWFVLSRYGKLINDLKIGYWVQFASQALFVDRGLPNTWFVKFSSVLFVHSFIWPYLKLNWSVKVWDTLFWCLCGLLFLCQLYFLTCFHHKFWVG